MNRVFLKRLTGTIFFSPEEKMVVEKIISRNPFCNGCCFLFGAHCNLDMVKSQVVCSWTVFKEKKGIILLFEEKKIK